MNPYLAPHRVHAALHALGLRPTRGMGQHFLVDADVLATIVSAADLAPADLVVEVGPGLGVLTWELLQSAGHVVSVELDRRLVARLRDELGDMMHFWVMQGDILKLPPQVILERAQHEWELRSMPSTYKVVANLPYAITSPVLRHFLEAHPQPDMLVVLVQWEVAMRIIAEPGKLSVLAHSVQMYAIPELIDRVSADSFIPRPAVDSAILRLRIRPAPVVPVDIIDKVFRVIKAGFLQPRKKLSNALPGGLAAMGKPVARDVAVAALEAAGVAADRRPETVTLLEWERVYHELCQRAGEEWQR